MIFEAIAAIKIANEAVSAIREMCQNINDISSIGSMGKDMTKLADAKEQIQKDAAQGDAEAFWALEDIKAKEKELRDLMIYGGRANLWSDYETFMRNRKQMRENERKRAEDKKLARAKAIKNGLVYGVVGIFTLGIVGGAVALLLFVISHRGR